MFFDFICINGKVTGLSDCKNLSDYGDILINGEDYSDNSIKTIRELLIVLNSAMHSQRLGIVFRINLPISSLRHMTKEVSSLNLS